MRKVKQCISFIAAAALTVSCLQTSGLTLTQASAAEADTETAVSVDKTIKITPTDASTFNDTNGDGLGEFEGWGTSLCWWANRIGYSEELTSQAAELFFSADGLNMNIGRYNVGGGDDVTDEEITYTEMTENEKATFYDLETEGYTPTYSGTSMSVSTVSMSSATYAFSDADFGFTKGDTVGSFSAIGYINALGAAVGSGDNLHYTVNVEETGTYTVKLLLTLSGTNSRSVGLRVGDSDSYVDYIVDSDTINSNIIASASNQKLYIAVIENVQLQAGDNEVAIGGDGDWTLDFVKMAVMKTGDEGEVPDEDSYLHSSHIIRSDSAVPGYCVDVTKMDLDNSTLEYYEENFDAADEESGYAWNYDWDADANQVNVLKAAIEAYQESNADEDETTQLFLAEAFSNSPPYFMTVSGCSSGNVDSSVDNLRSDCYTAFATYMADVIEHLINVVGLEISSTDPMNEPYTDYWGAYSNKQEGCHFDIGTSQSEIIVALNAALEERGIDIIISASDETSIDTAITSYNALSDEAKEIVDRIDTHTYSGSDRAGLSELAESEGKNLWMSEVDGAYTGGGDNAGEMSAAIGLATRMITDVSGLECSAWILWNAIDMHADSSETGQYYVNLGSANDYLTMEALEEAWGSTTSSGYWGLAAADHDNEEIVLSMKYYAYGQFSRYIRPGYTIIASSGNTLAAYDSEGDKVVIVAVNSSDDDKTWKFDLSGFETIGTEVTAIRTSGTLADGEHWADVTDSDDISVNTDENYFTATLLGNSITTYTIEGVSGILPAVETEYPAIQQIEVTADQVTGEKVWNNGTVNVATNVVDGDFDTFFDGVNTDDGEQGYVILDLGEVKEIAAIGYAPRSGFASRCVDAEIYGSVDGETWELIYTIEETPTVGENTIVYYMDFNSGSLVNYRYIKYTRDSECNLSELNVWELAPTIESQEAVSVSVSDLSDADIETLELPETVTVTLDNGETQEVSVTWDLSDVDLSELRTLYDSVTITGSSGEVNGTVTGCIVYAPDNLEYLIDCMTGDSPVAASQKGTTYTSEAWTAVQGLSTLLNTDSSDQLKTDENTWGLVSTTNINCWDWDYTGDGGHLYGYGYWAGTDANIEYQLTLPAGTHEITLGCFDYWSTRNMDVYYTVDDGTEQFLCTLTSAQYAPSTESVTITLKEEAVVTISVRNGGDGDPVLSMISVVKVPTNEETTLTAHYDMSHDGDALTDVSGRKNDATLYDTDDSDFASYNGEDVLQFNNEQYATIPSGVITDAASFTVQAVVSAQTSSDNWVWTIGDGIGSWGAGDISDYIFVAANSSQSGYTGTVLAAVKVGDESNGGEDRMDAPSEAIGAGYTTITLVSDGDTLTLYMDGEVVSTLTHDKDLSEMIPDGDILGYIGKSLYSTDSLLIANVADIMIWDAALTADELEAVAPTEEDETNMVLADIRQALLNGNASEDEIASDIALPSTVDGYDLTWTVSCEDGSVSEAGKVTVPLGDTSGTATVTVSWGDGLTATFNLTVPSTDVDSIMAAAAEEITIPNADDIRGNITLITETSNGVTVTWTTDHSEIVDVNSYTNEGYDDTPAGVVTRPDSDTTVTMTATLTYTFAGETYTETKEIVLTVKAAAAEIDEDDYTDYLFAYFSGEGYSDGENIFFASSEDGLNWDDLNNNEAVLTSDLGTTGARDPFIIRSPEGDKFYLIATDLSIYLNSNWTTAQTNGSQSLLVWESTDLVNWSEPRLVEVSADIDAGCTWAPEATYDETTGEYVVYWASKVADDNYSQQRVYYAKTRDFYTFTEPEVFIDNGDDSSIDTTIIQGDDGYFYRITKNESDSTNDQGALTKTVYIERSKTLLGEYESVDTNLNDFQWVEGPAIFKFNSDDADTSTWCLLVDDYGGSGYFPLITTDLTTFAKATDYEMPSRARHGTVLNITSEEYAALVAAYGTPDEVSAATYQGETPDLPDTVTMGDAEYAVTWDLDGVSFDGEIFSYVEVTGTLDGSDKTATANVQIIPKNIEYMIDCANTGSVTWKNALSLNSGLLNSSAADQEKTEDNTWGYTSILGTTNNDGGDIVVYSGSSTTDPYAGGYWAENGKYITYQLTLPAGEHTIMLGCKGWWSMDRDMYAYYSVDDGEEELLCNFDAKASSDTYSSGTITLEEEAVVTIVVKPAGSDDPIISWIAVTGEADETEVVDFTELQAQIDAAKALTESDYTAESYAKVTAALAAAEALVGNEEATQDEVDAAAAALKEAIEALVPAGGGEPGETVDKSALQVLYDAAAALDASAYTEESYAALSKALTDAKAVLEDAEATQAQVDAAKEALQTAIDGLVAVSGGGEEPTPVDKSALEALCIAAAAYEASAYTEESYATLSEALADAQKVLADEDATQAQVDAAAAVLQAAIDGLVAVSGGEEPIPPEEPETVDKTALQALYDDAAALTASDYTDESYAELSKAMILAAAALSDENATQDDVDAAAAALQDALDGLVAVSGGEEPEEPGDTDEVDKTELQEAYDAYSQIEQNDFTDESYQALQDALAQAAEVLSDENATEEEVATALADLKLALSELTVAATDEVEKDALQDLYDTYKDLTQDAYTDASYSAFTEALAAAAAVLADEDATQDEVSEAYSNLYDAVKGLTVAGGTSGSSGSSSDSSSSGDSTTAAKTGDTAPIAGLLALLAAAAVVALLAQRKRKGTI